MFICGSSSFSEVDTTPSLTPKKSKRSTSLTRNTNKNPYASRGLDKFYALLADLDDVKQKIYTEMGSEDISLVRFVYTQESDKFKPIIVKAKNKKKADTRTKNEIFMKHSSKTSNKVTSDQGTKDAMDVVVVKDDKEKENKCLLRCNGSFKIEEYLRQPYYHVVVMTVLIMVFLVVFGKSLAVLCTSIGWYLVPSVIGRGSLSFPGNERKLKKKKANHGQSTSPSSPKSVINEITGC